MKSPLWILLLLSSSTVAGQTVLNGIAAYRHHLGGLQNSVGAFSHSYDVIRYNLHMDWYDALSDSTHGFSGKMEITFVPSLQMPLDSIRLDSDPSYLSVDSAFSGGTALTTETSNGKLTVILDHQLYAGDTGVVDLYYHVIDPGVAPSPDSLQKGFYVYYEGEQVAGQPTVLQTVAYTMSEPSDARCWMPCYDDPSDKALCRIAVRVPAGFVVASNGSLDSTKDNGDGSFTFYWSENYPISTYLMCATAARFSVIRDSVTIGGKSIPVEYYVYPGDSSQALSNSQCNIDSVISMMRFYSSIYGDYPFDKYGMTGVEPFRYGGMEHQTVATMNRKYEFDRRNVAHELAHQWWGDMVTLGTWKDIWLNEGFATYSEAMQLQHASHSQFRDEMSFYANQYFIEDSTQQRYPVYAPPEGYIFGLAEYYKGAWVLNMLRNVVGDSAFFRIMRRYRSDYQYGNAVTSDFENVVDTVAQTDISWFFDEWVRGQGYPVYTKSYLQIGDTLSVTINQVQTNAPVFRMPIDIGVYSGSQVTVHSVFDSMSQQTFKFYFKAGADSVVLDPSNKILAIFPGPNMTEVRQNGNGPVNYTLLQNYPNPFNGMTRVVYHVAEAGMVTVELFDILGRKVETLARGFQAPGLHEIGVNVGNLASGVYVCRLTTPGRATAIKLVLEK